MRRTRKQRPRKVRLVRRPPRPATAPAQKTAVGVVADAGSATLVLPYAAPNLNDLLRARGMDARRRGKGDGYNATKKLWAQRVAQHVAEQCVPLFPRGAHIAFGIVERNRRRDCDNLCSGAAKLCLDGLVACGVLLSDGWDGVHSLRFSWETGTPCVRVTLTDVEAAA